MNPPPSNPSPSLTRRDLLRISAATAATLLSSRALAQLPPISPASDLTPALANHWLTRWQADILSDARNRYCDREMGEELGWLVSPFLYGFYFGYLATADTLWLDRLLDWSDSWLRRGITEPDGFIGWPKDDGASTQAVPGLHTDNMLGEAMALRPMVLLTNVIRNNPALASRYAQPARRYLDAAETVFTKWDSRACWRPIQTGGVWIVPEFGIDPQTGNWTAAYSRRATTGFTLPANKQNAIAQWLLALADVTGKPIYRNRARLWFAAMKSRIRPRADGYVEWNYWDTAGPWDFKPDGSTRHWVGIHPNGGYYAIDTEAIADAFQHNLIFQRSDIDRLIATNRDFMWNHQISGARFQRIDGNPPDPHWQDTPGVLWTGLLPYDPTLRRIFTVNHNPASWSGHALTPRYLFESRSW